MSEGVKDEWWFKKMLSSRQPIDTPSETQSKLLSELDSVYELQSMLDYIELFKYILLFGQYEIICENIFANRHVVLQLCKSP